MRREHLRRAWSAHFAGAGVHLRTAVVATAAMLLSFGSGLLLERAARLNVDIVFLSVVLSMSLTRTQRGSDRRRRLTGVVVLPLVAVAAGEIAQIMLHHRDFGDVLFVAALSGGIYLRRFGPLIARAGTLIAMPFIAMLVTPMPAPPTNAAPWWGAVATLIALAWSWGTEELAMWTGFLSRDPGPGARAGHAAPKPAAPRKKGLPASTRMALQMALALGSAFALGRWLFPLHWTWMVLTAFIVSSGNRGRGDVVHKALLRFGGAATGTIAAALLAGAFRPHDPAAVAVILATLSVATWLRRFSYAYWAGCVTAVLSILYGYFGEDSARLLPTRLEEIVLGAVLAVVVAWFVLPVRTADVVRGRLAEALAALSDVLAAARREPERLAASRARFDAAAARLGEVARPVTTHRRVLGRGRAHPADALEAVRDCVGSVSKLAALATTDPAAFAHPVSSKSIGTAALKVGEARRALGRRPGSEPVPRPRGTDETVHPHIREAVTHIIGATDTVRRVYEAQLPAEPAPPTPAGAVGLSPAGEPAYP